MITDKVLQRRGTTRITFSRNAMESRICATSDTCFSSSITAKAELLVGLTFYYAVAHCFFPFLESDSCILTKREIIYLIFFVPRFPFSNTIRFFISGLSCIHRGEIVNFVDTSILRRGLPMTLDPYQAVTEVGSNF